MTTDKAIKKGLSRSRARSPTQKAEIRQHILDIGRQLFANEEPGLISVRRIAKEAGYTPATIYNYFSDQLDLYATIREQDMQQAVAEIEKIANTAADPAARLQLIFASALEHWTRYPDHFEIIYAQRVDNIGATGGKPLGATPVATEFYQLYKGAVAAFLASIGNTSTDLNEATDTIVTAAMGILLFVRHTPTWRWSSAQVMAQTVVEALMQKWVADRDER